MASREKIFSSVNELNFRNLIRELDRLYESDESEIAELERGPLFGITCRSCRSSIGLLELSVKEGSFGV